MERILIIGCPGSGKSTFAKKLSKKLNYPILHLDRIFHIDNYNQISREELKNKIKSFIKNNKHFIIDGNYHGTLEFRLKYSDTVFYFNIDTKTCLDNVINRCKSGSIRDDIAEGFDNSIIDPEFIEYVKSFNLEKKPIIEDILDDFDGKIIKFYNYKDVENYLEEI
ncbi:AAA family ATPase [Candidatus Izemoplasma sp. B36]|uniref:AAA family ATPase n=1 Tax=Candidatus Izemoplasma sp. B36 TaxID=3242468 RepID=UPI003556E2E3